MTATKISMPRSPVPDAVLAFADALPWPAMLLDGEGRVVHLNPAAAARAGGKLRGRPPLEQLFPEYGAALRGNEPWLGERETELTRETPLGPVHERLWLRPLSGGACLVVADETRMRELEATDAQTARLASLGFMLAGVCHEVSNPLAAIYSMVQILQANPGLSPETLEKGLANIAANVKRILDVSKRLSDFSRVGDAPRSRFAVDMVVEEALVVLRQDHRFAEIEISHRPDPESVVLGNPGQLQEVFFNLFINAMQAMQGRGRIAVVTRHPVPERVEVEVRDNGPGIPPEHLPRLFEPFFTTKPVGQGSGLGLSISNEIVHEHGGAIRVANHPEGGACFVIELPCVRGGHDDL
ncbi:MAG: two-component sensor histidine kinase [Betaproteobacteria bacterium]|nr:two-component sensor histidine kinase [Betaproteobacteria bacterium]